MTAREILFADYCDFRARDVERLRMGGEIDPAEYYAAIVDAVLEIMAPGQYKNEPDDIYQHRVNVVTAQIAALEFGEPEHINQGLLSFGQELTTLRLYGHLLTVINTDTAPELPFEHPDENGVPTLWNICAEIDDYLLGGGKFTTGETITVVSLSQDFRKIRDEVGAGNADYLAFANVDFEIDLRTFAVLVRRPGELLPMNKIDRTKLIDSRIQVFATLPMDIVNGINFFLRATLVASILGVTTPSRHRTNFFGGAGILNSSPGKRRGPTRTEKQRPKRKANF
jgi:hypothetical protein